MRRAARTDDSHKAIVQALEQLGCVVLQLHAMGQGCPDLLVYARPLKRPVLMEVKNPKQPPSGRKLTPAQAEFHRRWPERVHIVHTPAEAISAAGYKLSTQTQEDA